MSSDKFENSSPVMILASQSPNRLAILKMIGFRPSVYVSNFEENLPKSLPVREYVELTAKGKMDEILENLKKEQRNFDIVIAADTMVCSGDKIYGKPVDENDAVETLKLLRGKPHYIYSGVIIAYKDGSQQRFSTETKVFMGNYSDQAILDYVATKEPMNKAGSYGIQNRAGALIERIEGCHFNVAGLPIGEIAAHLASKGFRPFGQEDSITPSCQISNPSARAGKIILASDCPEQITLLRKIGIEPIIKVPKLKGETKKGTDLRGQVEEKALEKLQLIKGQINEEKEDFAVIIASESIILCDGQVIERPKDRLDAIQILKKMRANSPIRLTGVAMGFKDGSEEIFHVETKILFTDLPDSMIEAYTEAEDVLIHPGAFGMQSKGAIFVKAVEGCYSNSVGLPVYEIARRLHDRGHRLWDF